MMPLLNRLVKILAGFDAPSRRGRPIDNRQPRTNWLLAEAPVFSIIFIACCTIPAPMCVQAGIAWVRPAAGG